MKHTEDNYTGISTAAHGQTSDPLVNKYLKGPAFQFLGFLVL